MSKKVKSVSATLNAENRDVLMTSIKDEAISATTGREIAGVRNRMFKGAGILPQNIVAPKEGVDSIYTPETLVEAKQAYIAGQHPTIQLWFRPEWKDVPNVVEVECTKYGGHITKWAKNVDPGTTEDLIKCTPNNHAQLRKNADNAVLSNPRTSYETFLAYEIQALKTQYHLCEIDSFDDAIANDPVLSKARDRSGKLLIDGDKASVGVGAKEFSKPLYQHYKGLDQTISHCTYLIGANAKASLEEEKENGNEAILFSEKIGPMISPDHIKLIENLREAAMVCKNYCLNEKRFLEPECKEVLGMFIKAKK